MSEYKNTFESRYKKDDMDYADEMDYLFMLNAPEQYGVENEMLKYLNDDSHHSVRELFEYFDVIAPKGLPIGDDGYDLLEDD